MRKKFTENEILFLKENFLTKGSGYCAAHLGRGQQVVISKCRAMGLRANNLIKYQNYEMEKFANAVKEAKSFSDVCRNLGLPSSCGNRKTVTTYIEKYKLDISHFDFGKSNLHDSGSHRRELDEILIENSLYRSSSSLKARLYKEGLKTHFCELCGQDEIWMGKRISLILDHINGVSNDNRLDNLRIVCPNCNATLDTHCGKNKKYNVGRASKKDFCRCGKEKYIVSDKCMSCNYDNVKRKVENRPSYEILKSEIENSNYCAVGRKYGVSDNAVRKWVKSYELNM